MGLIMKIDIVGGGISGFASAISLKENNKKIHVNLYEKNTKASQRGAAETKHLYNHLILKTIIHILRSLCSGTYLSLQIRPPHTNSTKNEPLPVP